MATKLSEDLTWRSWRSMVQRCTQPTMKDYEKYSALGICDEWRRSYPSFLAAMGERPSLDHSIDRIDNALGYFPGNCRWATRKEQGRNTRTNRMVTINGETRTVAEWAEVSGINSRTLGLRLDAGVPGAELLDLRNRRARGSRHANAKLTEEKVLEIKRAYAEKEGSERVIALRFGVSPMTVHLILSGQTWCHVKAAGEGRYDAPHKSGRFPDGLMNPFEAPVLEGAELTVLEGCP